jgi:hypothetical protein
LATKFRCAISKKFSGDNGGKQYCRARAKKSRIIYVTLST